MVRTLTSVYLGGESLPIQGICARYRGRPARSRWGQNNRSVAQPAEYFCGGARAMGTFPGKHWAVCCRATALRSPYRHFCLGQCGTMALTWSQCDGACELRYSQCSLTYSSCITLAPHKRSLLLLNSPRLLLTSSFLLKIPTPPFLSSIYRTSYHTLSDTSPHMYLHAYVLPVPSLALKIFMLIGAGFGNRTTETILHAQRRERFVLGARGGCVACATEM